MKEKKMIAVKITFEQSIKKKYLKKLRKLLTKMSLDPDTVIQVQTEKAKAEPEAASEKKPAAVKKTARKPARRAKSA